MIPNVFDFLSLMSDFFRFKSMEGSRRLPINFKDIRLYKEGKSQQSSFDAHYVYHTSWAARILARIAPKEHVDISSSLYFVGLVSAFIPVKFYDYRLVHLSLKGATIGTADLTSLLFPDASIPSLSCMHVVEHIGLGRYGDPIDPNGDLKAMSELKRVLSKGGDLLFVVPIGFPKIVFHAHRIYSFAQIQQCFHDLKLMEFMLVCDDASVVFNASEDLANSQKYGCGCFWFRKE